jgi:hypothetical protein
MTTPRDDMELVCRSASDFAIEQIAKHGDFIPFAVVIDHVGGLRFVQLGEDQVKDGGERSLTKIREILRTNAKKGAYMATAVASDVRVRLNKTGEITDAIRVEVEHASDEPITCMLPYCKTEKGFEQRIDPYLEPGDRTVFS